MFEQQADIQKQCQVSHLPPTIGAQPAAAMPQQAQELQHVQLYMVKGIPQTSHFCYQGSTTVPAVLPLTIGTDFICHTGATEEAVTFLTPEAVSTGALAG